MIRLTASTYARLTGDPSTGLGQPAKYRNVKVDTPDGRFDSKREYDRWCQLRVCERAGLISNLRRQVRYPLVVNGVKIATYAADMVYEQGGATVVEDVKAIRTQAYILKRKLMLALHGIDIKEV
jgi:hypothetical protein